MANNKVLIITGPTASGKTQLSEKLLPIFDGEIINADVGQFYRPLSIGTAKPDLSVVKYSHHLFDLIDLPQDLSVFKFRQLVSEKVDHICSMGKTPIIVGGSLFYIKSLFFPPAPLGSDENAVSSVDLNKFSETELWQLLQSIDPERAIQIHPNDAYRIRRALDIWKRTGKKPSFYKPVCKPLFDALIVFMCPPADILTFRIGQRTEQMIKLGWIDEARSLVGTDWQNFVCEKGLIGYPEIFEWISAGQEPGLLPNLISKIRVRTIQYAKRQKTFWRSFTNQIRIHCEDEYKFFIKTLEVGLADEFVKQLIIGNFTELKKLGVKFHL